MSTICSACGIAVIENVQHSCRAGASSATSAVVAPMPSAPKFSGTALAPNLAGALAYGAGFISGIAFLVLEPYKRDDFVRFHAWQSILFSLAWIAFWIPGSIVASMLLSTMVTSNPGLAMGGGLPFIAFLITAVTRLLGLTVFAFWLLLLYKAHGGHRFQIPVIGKFAILQARKR
jgi:uncharacterized membrane protein